MAKKQPQTRRRGAPKLKFSEEFDKLKAKNFLVGNRFTTGRPYTPQKDFHYHQVYIHDEEAKVYLYNALLGKVRFVEYEHKWSDELTSEEIKKETYSRWTSEDLAEMNLRFSGNPRVYYIWITAEITEVEEFDSDAERPKVPY